MTKFLRRSNIFHPDHRACMGGLHRFFGCLSSVLASGVAVCLCAGVGFTQVTQNTAFDLAGNSVDPLRTANGKVAVFVFVRTDCPISNRYAPTIQELGARHADKASFWLVYPGKSESAEMIRKHVEEFRYKLPALRDPQHVLTKLSQAQVTPEAAVFDGKGHLVYHGRIDNLYEDFGRARKAATTHELDDAIVATAEGKSVTIASQPAVGCYVSDLE